jgi:dinuclear metal center YbgI/SA1388 family protein
MATLTDIVSFLDAYLDLKSCPNDDSWNGLQIEGNATVSKVFFTTDAGIQTFEKAIEHKADMIVVHHGLFWDGTNPSYRGATKRRVELLIKHGISLYAAHLPLDKHPIVGNNAQILAIMGFEKDKPFALYKNDYISFIGKTEKPKAITEIQKILENNLGAQCKTLAFGPKEISTIAVCSGGGGYEQLFEAVDAGVDLYVTGDATECYHTARDNGLNVIFAGHHATEIVGVRALAPVVGKECSVETIFVDVPTGL